MCEDAWRKKKKKSHICLGFCFKHMTILSDVLSQKWEWELLEAEGLSLSFTHPPNSSWRTLIEKKTNRAYFILKCFQIIKGFFLLSIGSLHHGLPAVTSGVSGRRSLLKHHVNGTGVYGRGSYQLKPDVLSCFTLHFTPANQLTLFKIQSNSQNFQQSAYIFMLMPSIRLASSFWILSGKSYFR